MLMLQPVNVEISDDIFFPEELGRILTVNTLAKHIRQKL